MAVYNKYHKEVYQVSYNGGASWEDVSPAQYRKGTLMQLNSPDCTPAPPVPGQPFTIVPTEKDLTVLVWGDCLRTCASIYVYYSYDRGQNWTKVLTDGSWFNVNVGQKISFKVENYHGGGSSGIAVRNQNNSDTVVGKFYVEGDLGTMKHVGHSEGFQKGQGYFSGMTSLTSAENLVIPDSYCGRYMFSGCTSLTTPPQLPATTLTSKCYLGMFANCSSLTVAPALPATTLAEGCYWSMFYNCTSLTTAPQLLATTLAEHCYDHMFYFCTSLTTAPILPATTLASNCYNGMFSNCTSLTTAPDLLAPTLADYCYYSMFYNCTRLNYIRCLATNMSASYCTFDWTNGVPSSGTFIKHCDANWSWGYNGIPNNWTVNCEGIAYRWHKAPITEYECVGTDKHYVEYYQYSNDGGNTWQNVEPVSSRTSPDVIEYESEDCGYDYSVFSGMYLTFEAIDDATFSITRAGGGSGIIKYSLDSGTTWTTYSSSVSVNAGNQIWWSGNTTSSGETAFQRGIGTFNSTGRFKAYGNATSILNNRSTAAANSRLGYLFKDNTYLVSAGGLYLVPSGQPYSIYHNQYVSMFEGCSRLIKAPKLPFINLGQCCYLRMFKGCTSLETAPSLPAIDIPPIAYNSMFAGCTSLKTIPTFSVGLAAGFEALQYMFSGCTSLVDASTVILNATTEYDYCYCGMFSGCTALETAPALTFNNPQKFTGEIYNVFQRTYNWQCMGMFYGCTNLRNISNINLRATSLKDYCYYFMFYNCASLTTTPILPATTLAEGCYCDMFRGCTSLTTAPDLNVRTLVKDCYQRMFNSCSSLNYIKCLATDISAEYCTAAWVTGVASSGTFVKNSSMSSWTTGTTGIPNGWTIQNA